MNKTEKLVSQIKNQNLLPISEHREYLFFILDVFDELDRISDEVSELSDKIYNETINLSPGKGYFDANGLFKTLIFCFNNRSYFIKLTTLFPNYSFKIELIFFNFNLSKLYTFNLKDLPNNSVRETSEIVCNSLLDKIHKMESKDYWNRFLNYFRLKKPSQNMIDQFVTYKYV